MYGVYTTTWDIRVFTLWAKLRSLEISFDTIGEKWINYYSKIGFQNFNFCAFSFGRPILTLKVSQEALLSGLQHSYKFVSKSEFLETVSFWSNCYFSIVKYFGFIILSRSARYTNLDFHLFQMNDIINRFFTSIKCEFFSKKSQSVNGNFAIEIPQSAMIYSTP